MRLTPSTLSRSPSNDATAAGPISNATAARCFAFGPVLSPSPGGAPDTLESGDRGLRHPALDQTAQLLCGRGDSVGCPGRKASEVKDAPPGPNFDQHLCAPWHEFDIVARLRTKGVPDGLWHRDLPLARKARAVSRT